GASTSPSSRLCYNFQTGNCVTGVCVGCVTKMAIGSKGGSNGFQEILSLAGRPRKPQAVLALARLAVDRDRNSAGSRRREDGKLQSRTGHRASQRHFRAGRSGPDRYRLYQTLSRPRQIRLVGAYHPYPNHRRDLDTDRTRLSQRHAGVEPVRPTGDGLIAYGAHRGEHRQAANARQELGVQYLPEQCLVFASQSPPSFWHCSLVSVGPAKAGTAKARARVKANIDTKTFMRFSPLDT